jgi:hypothetical protein
MMEFRREDDRQDVDYKKVKIICKASWQEKIELFV